MSKHLFFKLSLFLLVGFTSMHSQTKESGPVITGYGEVWNIENPDFITDIAKEYKVVFDIMNTSESSDHLNKSIETAARFLNMHAQSGVPIANLKVALVVHNNASKDLLRGSEYKSRYGTDNPNEELIQKLLDAGVEIVLCGQSSVARNVPVSETIDGVELALSAMTALIQLQDNGFQLIKF
ncbi:DsrE family protein [uncultured Eudoraea sp.]|uniref:DsrE family protein n=1 Tax=uncultured Eudoraea sp. TaxID=1035614 RepID=UPI00262C6E96|nr:DsrE family protein [uncultured Eudoraea sp.]